MPAFFMSTDGKNATYYTKSNIFTTIIPPYKFIE